MPSAAVPASYDFQTIALDLEGKLLPGTPVRVDMFQRNRRSERAVLPDGRIWNGLRRLRKDPNYRTVVDAVAPPRPA